ncbi:hypothetical protein Tco_1201774, partial [Tanacetum coccineum]
MILSGADNRPPMLDKDLYGSWKSRMELYMQNREHGRMILESVEHGLLADIYSLVNHHRVAKDLWERVQLLMQGFDVLVFSPRDDLIACLNKAMAFLTAVISSRGDKDKIILVLLIRAMLRVQREILQVDRQELVNATTAKVKDIWLGNALSQSNQGMMHELDIVIMDSDCDDLSTTQAILMANISNYDSDIISEDFEQSPVMDVTDNEISSNSNIISYSQYLQETQQATVQDTNFLITSVFGFYVQSYIEPSNSPPVYNGISQWNTKASLVNASLKKLKFHLTQFDSVVKKRTTPSALEEEYFEINDLKARLEDKDTTISKLKDTIKSLKKNTKEKNVHHEKCDLEPINEELENSVAKLLSENEQLWNKINHVKQ